MFKITPVSLEEKHEIIKLEDKDLNLIMYAYKDFSVVLDAKKENPHIIAVYQRAILTETIRSGKAPHTLPIMYTLTIKEPLNIPELYYTSVSVLKLVNCQHKAEYYYSGRAHYDEKTQSYTFKFTNRVIRIGINQMIDLIFPVTDERIQHAVDIYNGAYTITSNGLYAKITYANGAVYKINILQSIDNIDILHTYKKMKLYCRFAQFKNMKVHRYNTYITHEEGYAMLVIKTSDLIDLLFYGKNKISGEFIFTNNKYQCACNYKILAGFAMLHVVIHVADSLPDLVLDLPIDNIRTLFKNGIIEGLKDE